MSAFLAVDWGTTNCRAWRVEAGGAVSLSKSFPLGVKGLKPGEAAARFQSELRPAMQAEDLPALLCGMIGSDLGWRAVPYRDCPAGLDEMAASLVAVEAEGPPVRIVPGLRCQGIAGAPDVLRGEETPVFGWVADDPARARGRRLVHHPGTHAKWLLVEDGRVVRFVTAMTGELFDVLSKHSLLRSEPEVGDGAGFEAGLAAAGDGGALASRLFSTRARVVGGGEPASETRGYLSGLLIGAEVSGVPPLLGCEGLPVEVVGDARLVELYERAMRARGIEAHGHAGDAATLRGLRAMFERVGR
jgi:2-dehydro-3-deoxygalactonokinase